MTHGWDQAQAVLSFEQVSRTFPGPPEVPALLPFDLAVHPGDFLTIVGPSGSGKSTLLHLAGLLDRPSTGQIVMGGQDTTTLPEAKRAAARGAWIGFVFQAFHLLHHRSVLDNVMLAGLYRAVAPSTRREMSRQVIETVGLSHRVDAPAGRLSGGEKQRVAIARAVVSTPRLLLCDEPTGNLDSASSEGIVELLRGLNHTGMTIVMITHNLDLAAVGNRTVSVLDGVVHDG